MRKASLNALCGQAPLYLELKMLINLILIMITKKWIISFLRCGSERLRKVPTVTELAGDQIPEKGNRSSLLFPLSHQFRSSQKKYLKKVSSQKSMEGMKTSNSTEVLALCHSHSTELYGTEPSNDFYAH